MECEQRELLDLEVGVKVDGRNSEKRRRPIEKLPEARGRGAAKLELRAKRDEAMALSRHDRGTRLCHVPYLRPVADALFWVYLDNVCVYT